MGQKNSEATVRGFKPRYRIKFLIFHRKLYKNLPISNHCGFNLSISNPFFVFATTKYTKVYLVYFISGIPKYISFLSNMKINSILSIFWAIRAASFLACSIFSVLTSWVFSTIFIFLALFIYTENFSINIKFLK